MLDKYVAKQLVLAQVASDGGKNQTDVLSRVGSSIALAKLYNSKGYEQKDYCIIEAIKAIQKNPKTGFRYSVKVDKTLRNNRHRFIVYFNFKLDGERYQISFHTFSNMWRFVNQRCITRWQKKHSSKESAIKLAYYVARERQIELQTPSEVTGSYICSCFD